MNSQQFIVALHQLEDNGDIEPLVKLYAEHVQIWSPELNRRGTGLTAAREFWKEYRATFASVHSDFHLIIECDSTAALEWESKGVLEANKKPFNYRGVTILEWSDNHICRFATYFDPHELYVEHPHPVFPSEQERAA